MELVPTVVPNVTASPVIGIGGACAAAGAVAGAVAGFACGKRQRTDEGRVTMTVDIMTLLNRISDLEKQVDLLVNGKADAGAVYTKEEVDQKLKDARVKKEETECCHPCANCGVPLQSAAEVIQLLGEAQLQVVAGLDDLRNILQQKADMEDVYTKEQVEGQLNSKADAVAVYTKEEVDQKCNGKVDRAELQNVIQQKADMEAVYTKKLVEDKLIAVYTKEEIDQKCNGKVDMEVIQPLEDMARNLRLVWNSILTLSSTGPQGPTGRFSWNRPAKLAVNAGVDGGLLVEPDGEHILVERGGKYKIEARILPDHYDNHPFFEVNDQPVICGGTVAAASLDAILPNYAAVNMSVLLELAPQTRISVNSCGNVISTGINRSWDTKISCKITGHYLIIMRVA